MGSRPTLLFDLDNTLVTCAPYYATARESLVADQSQRTGLPPEVVQRTLDAIDQIGMQIDDWSARRLPTTFRLVSEVLDRARGVSVDMEAAEAAVAEAEAVFHAPYDPLPEVHATLLRYYAGGWRLRICTKGEPWVQWRKVVRAGFDELVESVHVFADKRVATWKAFLEETALDPKTTLVIGDSWEDDIVATHAAGLNSVWIHPEAVAPGVVREGERTVPCVPGVAMLPQVVAVRPKAGAWRGKAA